MTAPNPKDSMKTTWRDDHTQWRPQHYLLSMLAPSPAQIGPAPVFQKTDKVPMFHGWTQDAWILVHASWPIIIQYAYAVMHDGRSMSSFWTFILYTAAFQLNSIHLINILARIGARYGYLDGDKHIRDDVPDVGVGKALSAVILTTTIRPLFTVLLTYDGSANTQHLPTYWLPVELLLYSLVLDFFFYFYHRACHEVDWLWKYHRTHHLTKHPSPFLSAYADSEQEIIEIAIVPILSFAVLKYGFGLPMTFLDWWVCHEFIIFSEAMGHSGIRVFSSSPGASRPLLTLFGCELTGEDHDLHHRKGYRKSYNYGKQTRFWDKIFGTCIDRPEMQPSNLRYDNKVMFPLL